MTIINTNSHSLCPKIDSLVVCFEEMKVDIAVVTETWFRGGDDLDQDLRDLEDGAGLCTLALNRPPNRHGVSHGGVAIITRKNLGTFKRIEVNNPECYEVLPAVGTLRGTSRKVIVIAVYIPPNYTVARGNACMDFVENVVIDMKRKFRDPYIVLAGDFNQWAVQESLVDFPDITEVAVGPLGGTDA